MTVLTFTMCFAFGAMECNLVAGRSKRPKQIREEEEGYSGDEGLTATGEEGEGGGQRKRVGRRGRGKRMSYLKLIFGKYNCQYTGSGGSNARN